MLKKEVIIGYFFVIILVVGIGVSLYYASRFAQFDFSNIDIWEKPKTIREYFIYNNETELEEHNVTNIIVIGNTNGGSFSIVWTEYNMTNKIWEIVVECEEPSDYIVSYNFHNGAVQIELKSDFAAFTVYFNNNYNYSWSANVTSDMGSISMSGKNVNIENIYANISMGSFSGNFVKCNISYIFVAAALGSIALNVDESTVNDLSLLTDMGSISLDLENMYTPNETELFSNTGSISIDLNLVNAFNNSRLNAETDSGSISFDINLVENATCKIEAETKGSIDYDTRDFIVIQPGGNKVILQTPDFEDSNGLMVTLKSSNGSISIRCSRGDYT